MKNQYDVVIIGAGIIGVSAAYFLAREGCDVCVVDRNVIGQESTGRCAGNIGRSHRQPADIPAVLRAVEFWKKLSASSDVDFEYRQHGNLRLAMNEDHARKLKAMVEREQEFGLDSRFIDKEETRSIVPHVADVYHGSVHTPLDGSAEPYLACWAIAKEARKHGAAIHEHVDVTGIDIDNGKITGVQTKAGRISCGKVVNTAGAWCAEVGAMAGIRIPAEVRLSHLIVTEPLPHFLDPVLSTDLYGYFRQTPSGNVLIGFAAKPTDGYDYRVSYEALKTAARRAAIIIPRLREASIIRAFTGFTTWTKDYLPIVGPVSEIEGLYLACAFCGLGFADGPGIGELVAELVAHNKTSLPIDAYRPERFNQVQAA
ncbi:MAG: FAD-binding oxidoreductase [Pseudomonadota bacterium]